MKKPLIEKRAKARRRERGVTMVLVAISMVAIVAMAALSIDVITLYLAKEEAQRAADAAALAAAKIISVSGITGDPNNLSGNWLQICGPDDGTNGLATRVAKTVASQNTIGGLTTATPTITYSYAGAAGGIADCQTLAGTPFAVNPLVTVSLTRTGLPTFFSRIWGYTGQQVTSVATAEAYNSSGSGIDNQANPGTLVPVQPRCVKPWIVPNQDPYNPSTSCTGAGCSTFVNIADGSITHGGISLNGTGANGVIGETFWLIADCLAGGTCNLLAQPQANYSPHAGPPPELGPNLLYVPGQVGTPVIGVPSCTTGDSYEEAIEGCDQPTNYSCGQTPGNGGTNVADLTIDPVGSVGSGPTTLGVQCLTHQSNVYGIGTTTASGQDYLFSTSGALGAPSTFPFQIIAGSSNPLLTAGLPANSAISASPSIVSLPIYDNSGSGNPTLNDTPPQPNPVTFVGFLQVFINAVDQSGNINVTVLNVTGCTNSVLSGTSSIIGNSPVPVRLITPPAQ